MEVKTKIFYTVSELADMMSVRRETIYRMAKRGELPFVKFGKSLRFNADEIDKLLESVKSSKDHKQTSLEGMFEGGGPIDPKIIDEVRDIWNIKES